MPTRSGSASSTKHKNIKIIDIRKNVAAMEERDKPDELDTFLDHDVLVTKGGGVASLEKDTNTTTQQQTDVVLEEDEKEYTDGDEKDEIIEDDDDVNDEEYEGDDDVNKDMLDDEDDDDANRDEDDDNIDELGDEDEEDEDDQDEDDDDDDEEDGSQEEDKDEPIALTAGGSSPKSKGENRTLIELLSKDPLFVVLGHYLISKNSGDNIATVLDKINSNIKQLVDVLSTIRDKQ